MFVDSSGRRYHRVRRRRSTPHVEAGAGELLLWVSLPPRRDHVYFPAPHADVELVRAARRGGGITVTARLNALLEVCPGRSYALALLSFE